MFSFEHVLVYGRVKDKISIEASRGKKTLAEITCYVGSNAATPTASLTALTDAIKSRRPRLPFIKEYSMFSVGRSMFDVLLSKQPCAAVEF